MDAGSRISDEVFGDLLRRYRLAAGLTQEALAERASMSARGISDLERGARTRPQRETVKLLVAALNLSDADHARLLAASRATALGIGTPLPNHPIPGGAGLSARAPLPVPPHPLIGREQEMARAIRFLHDPSVRLLTLTGPGGVGKTRLALAIAQEVLPAFPDGVVFVDLSPLRDPDQVLPTLADALGVREKPDVPLPQVLQAWLGRRSTLLVLDNFEQVIPAAPAVAALLAACPHVNVLVTSRIRLNLRGEQEYAVDPLAVPSIVDASPTPEALTAVMAHPAVALFVARVQAVKPGFHVSYDTARDIVRICQQLDGLPLALELAAAWSKLLSPAGILARLQSGQLALAGGARDVAERQQTIRSTIAWSYDLLTPDQQRLLRRLAVFVGGWTLAAAEAIGAAGDEAVPDVLAVLRALMDHSLVVERLGLADEPRYGLLETIRAFAHEQLEASGELPLIAHHHALWMLALAERAAAQLEGPEQAVWLEVLAPEHDNVRSAFFWAVAAGELEIASRLIQALALYWMMRGPLSEELEWIQHLLATPEVLPDGMRAYLLIQHGGVQQIQGHLVEAEGFVARGLEVARAVGLLDEEIGALALLGGLALQLGDGERAIALGEEAVTRLRTAPTASYPQPFMVLGWAEQQRGNRDRARQVFGEGLAIARRRGDHHWAAEFITYFGDLACDDADYAGALRSYHDALDLRLSNKDRWGAADVFVGMCDVAAVCDQMEQAARLLGAAERRYDDSGIGLPPISRFSYDRIVETIRTGLGEPRFSTVRAEGFQFDFEQAVAVAMTITPCDTPLVPTSLV